MMKRLLSLELKQFFRSKAFNQSLAVKILIGFAALYFMGSFLILGIGAFFILEESFPDKDPLIIVNSYLIYWFAADLAYRFFLQNLPVINIKPLMILPIKKSKIIHYLLGKTIFSFFNFLPLFFFIPFAAVLISKGYPIENAISWFFTMIFIELTLNYLNFLINKINAVFYVILILFLGIAGLEYFGIFDVSAVSENIFNQIYETPYAFLIPVLSAVLLYKKNYDFLKKGFYLDDKISEKVKEAKTHELNWLNRFGSIAVFLKNDIRMIMRNKRPRQVMLTSIMFLFYGLIFFTQEHYLESYTWIIFAGLFVTGGFLMSFGQLVPSWDSEYYKLLMSQNIPYRKYLEAKWYLLISGTLIAFILSIPYLYFGWEVYTMIILGAIYNIGLNSHITLFGGALHRVPVELNVKAKAFSNTQGFNATQLLIALPKIGLPIILFFVPYLIFGFKAGVITLVLISLSGLVFKDFFLNQIEKVYQKGKYKTIQAYAEKK